MGPAGARDTASELKRSGPRLAWVCAIAALSQLACIHGPRPAPLVPQAPQEGRTHVVQPGENLYRIAMKEGVPVEQLEAENGIDDPTQLAIGQTLFIPGGGAGAKMVGTPTVSTAVTQDAPPVSRKDANGNPLLLWPVRGVIFSTFGHRGDEHHDGVDLAAPEGTPIVAAADGTVLFAGQQRGYGDIVIVEHGGDLVTVYAHNRENLVEPGEHVQRGQTIAKVGRTGNATGPHVHFEVRVGARPQDPLEFLR